MRHREADGLVVGGENVERLPARRRRVEGGEGHAVAAGTEVERLSGGVVFHVADEGRACSR